MITAPDGTAETDSRALVDGAQLAATLTFSEAGFTTVELMGRGPDGPHVAAIFKVDVGAAAAPPPEVLTEPTEPMAKAEAVLARIAQLRAKKGLPVLTHDHTLDVLALEHAEDMATHHFFAHVSPTRGDLHQRLENRYSYAKAGENLGEASGALAAEQAIEASPAHLQTLLDKAFNRVGLALYPDYHPGGQVTLILVEVFAAVAPHLEDPASAVARELQGHRSQAGLGALARDPTLDGVARRHLAFMIRDGEPEPVTSIEDEAATLEPELKAVAVDVFVASLPSDAVRSKNLAAADFNRVGVAAVEHSSDRYGPGRLWVCVIYGSANP